MIDTVSKNACVGCGACRNICPTGSIVMKPDGEGFYYPEIRPELCVKCGLCDKVCLARQKPLRQEQPAAVYAARCRDDGLRRSSSSGGVFTLLARAVLARGGVVFGAAFDPALQVAHTGARTEEQLAGMRGSKYVQSRIEGCYQEARELLEQGAWVLFSGTPCQIDGLRRFLAKDYDRLIAQDLLCHGAPSPRVWQAYLDHWAGKTHSPVARATFRDKALSWRNYFLTLHCEDGGRVSHLAARDMMMRAYLADLCSRPACYTCPSGGADRSSDITLGDFWNIHAYCPELDDDGGISLVVCRSEKGRRLLEEVSAQLLCRVVDPKAAFSGGAGGPVRRPEAREAFLAAVGEHSLEWAVKHYCPMPPRLWLRTLPRQLLRRTKP